VHHLVVYNLGEGRNGYDRNDAPVFAGGPSVGGAATGAILKGDYNRMWQCTIFNTSVHGQGDLCPTTKQLGPAPGRSFPLLRQQNEHSVYLNTAAKLITGQVREKRHLTFLSFLVQLDDLPTHARDKCNEHSHKRDGSQTGRPALPEREFCRVESDRSSRRGRDDAS
jgi:hypothetical protein